MNAALSYARSFDPPEADGVGGSDTEDTLRAVLNILEDFAAEKARLGETERAVFNILEDVEVEKRRLEDTQRAVINVLEDLQIERNRFEQANLALEREVAERRRAEAEIRNLSEALAERAKQLEEANKELEAFSYSVSHDLRAPLRAIDGFGRALQTCYRDQLDDRAKHYLDRMRAGSQKLSNLIDDLLSLSRITRTTVARERINLSDVAHRILSDFERREPERHVECRIDEGIVVRGDPNLLTIALENLLGNAWKFTRSAQDARIEVGRTREGSEDVFFVRDNGAGFDMAYENKLFVPFQRLHTEDEFEGTGVGLATVQRIVRRHGGRVWAFGEIGRGATFSFTLGS